MCQKRRCETSTPLNEKIRLDYSHRKNDLFEIKPYELREKILIKARSLIKKGE